MNQSSREGRSGGGGLCSVLERSPKVALLLKPSCGESFDGTSFREGTVRRRGPPGAGQEVVQVPDSWGNGSATSLGKHLAWFTSLAKPGSGTSPIT